MTSIRHDPKRRKTPVPGVERSVPRPFDKQLTGMFFPDKWKSWPPIADWYPVAKEIAKEHGCRLVADREKSWKESHYVRKRGRRPTVFVGCAGDPHSCCAAFLHEMGHHILEDRHQHPGGVLAGEKAAWAEAHRLAREHRIPLPSNVRDLALHAYRRAAQLAEVPGGKRRHRRRSAPHTWDLEASRRSQTASFGWRSCPAGRRGKRHTKRLVKKAVHRAERRRPIQED